MSRLTRHLSLLTLISGCALSSARAADYVAITDFLANPAPHVQVEQTKAFRVTDTILIPTVHLRIMTGGSVFATKSSGSSTAAAKGTFTVLGLEKDALMTLATELQAKFVARLKADGWKVLTYDDVKGDAETAKLPRRKADGPLGLPEEKDGGGRLHYAVVTPSAEQAFEAPAQGVPWMFRAVGKARNATVVVPQIDIYAPQVWTETRKGYSSASATVKTLPGMNLNYAMVLAFTPKGGGGVVAKMKYAVLNLGENVGTFIDTKNTTPGAANGISKGLGILGGGGSINRVSAEYQFAVEPKAFNAAVLRGGEGFLNHVAKVLAPEKP